MPSSSHCAGRRVASPGAFVIVGFRFGKSPDPRSTMRYNRVIVASGTLRTSAFGVRHLVVFAVVLVALIWAGVAFAQEAYIGHKLSQQVADLRHQNGVFAAQNQGYKKDVQSITSGTADEEEARLNGYSKPQERLYLVTAAPSPSPTPAATPSPSASPHH
jgi:cell division protein FtsB